MYRENASELLGSGQKTLFIPKNGGLNDYIAGLLPQIGIDIRQARSDLEIIATRGEDIPKKVFELSEQGRNAYGITGDDLFDEYRLSYSGTGLRALNTYDWFDEKAMFTRPALCLLNQTGNIDDLPTKAIVGINRKYQKQSMNYIDKVLGPKGVLYQIRIYNGDLERNIGLGINDCVIEIVYSGDSVRKTGLKVADIVRFSDIVLIGKAKKPVFEQEYDGIRRRAQKPTESYTSKLLASDNEIIKKIGQENAELIQAFVKNEDLIPEALDSLYAMMLALAKRGVDWKEIEQTMISRW